MTLLAAYNFDETSGDILDASGNGLNIPISAPAVRSSGRLTQSAAGIFLAPAAHLSVLQTPQRSMTMKVREASSVTGWIAEFNDSSIDSGCWGLLFLSGQWQCQARNASGFVRAGVTRPTDGLDHDVAFTYDGSNVRFYLDGTLVSTQPLTGPLRTANVYRFQDQSGSAVQVDDVRFFDQALSLAQIQALIGVPVTAGRSGKPKVWSGSAWVPHQAKVWNGSAWVPHPMSAYDGTGFVKSK